MKFLSKLLLVVILLSGLFTACLKYDDAAIRYEISLLDERLKKVEELVETYNQNIESIQSLVNSMNGKVFVSSVTEVGDGYVINFSDGKTATIKNGKDGQDGRDGANGSTPLIGAKQDTDGEWYWTVNGEWLLGGDWNKMRVTGRDGENGKDGKDGENGKDGKDGENGKDGQDGKDGKDGVDAIAPQLKIVDDYWYISTDGGKTWEKLYKATGEDGAPGVSGSMFSDIKYDDSYVYLTLKDGTSFTVSRGASVVQAIEAIPDFGDGSVDAKAGDFKIRFEILPASAAAGLGALPDNCFSVKAFYARTKAYIGGAMTLPIIDKYIYDGILYLTVDGSVLGAEFTAHSLGATASLTIDDGITAISSGYFPLYEDGGRKNGHNYVDLGLSVVWADCNLGASAPEAYGYYYAWGEINPKGSFTWENYKWGNPPTKYLSDGLERLESADDAAFESWGHPWRMPTKSEFDELVDPENCTWTWSTLNDVVGYKVISKKPGYEGKSIFMPAAGTFWNSTLLQDEGIVGYYWSANAYLEEPHDAYILHFAHNFPRVPSNNRGAGCCIRPVSEK